MCSVCGTSHPTYDLRPYPPIDREVVCLSCLWERFLVAEAVVNDLLSQLQSTRMLWKSLACSEKERWDALSQGSLPTAYLQSWNDLKIANPTLAGMASSIDYTI